VPIKPTPTELEARLLSSIVTLDDVTYCERAGVSDESFLATEPAELGEVWNYVVKHTRDNGGKMPTDTDLESLFGFVSTGPGDLRTYVAAVRERELKYKARGVLMLNIAGLADDAEASAVETLRRTTTALGELQAASGRRVTSSTRPSAGARSAASSASRPA
jgi:hypothetical protein